MEEQIDFGKRFNKIRTEKKMPRLYIAKKLGVTANRIKKWENTPTLPDEKYLRELSRVLYVSYDYLVGKASQPTQPTIIPNLRNFF